MMLVSLLLSQTVSKRVDSMREALEKAEAERDACKSDASANKAQVQALQSQVQKISPHLLHPIIHGYALNSISCRTLFCLFCCVDQVQLVRFTLCIFV